MLHQQAAVLDHLDAGAREGLRGRLVADAELEPDHAGVRGQDVVDVRRDVARPAEDVDHVHRARHLAHRAVDGAVEDAGDLGIVDRHRHELDAGLIVVGPHIFGIGRVEHDILGLDDDRADELPFTLGHENAGWVERVGPGVRGVDVVPEYLTGNEWFFLVNGMLDAAGAKYPGHLIATNGYANRYVPPEDIPGFNRYNNLTIMFADICGYTALAEDRDPPRHRVGPLAAAHRMEGMTTTVTLGADTFRVEVKDGGEVCVEGTEAALRVTPEGDGTWLVDEQAVDANRVAVGLEPACIKACPTGCLHFGTKDDMKTLAESRARQLREHSGFANAGVYDPPGVGGTCGMDGSHVGGTRRGCPRRRMV